MYLWVILVVKLKVPLSGAVTIDNTGLVVVDDAVTTAKILDGTILISQLML
jgi:hypothetical protein